MILQEVYKMTNPKDRADSLQKLMPYVYPQLSATQANVNITSDESKPLAKLSNEDLIARAKIILERGPNDQGRLTGTMEQTDPTAGGDLLAEGHSDAERAELEDGAGEDQ
jgi:hypothetical protein